MGKYTEMLRTVALIVALAMSPGTLPPIAPAESQPAVVPLKPNMHLLADARGDVVVHVGDVA